MHHYFNSGVMLMNLKKIRNEKLHEKLIESKKWMTTSLVDQDSFNYVMFGNVKFVSLKFNTIIDALYRHIVNKKISLSEINKKTNSKYVDFDEILTSSHIIHFGSYYKPWNFYDMICADLWIDYFLKSPLKHIKLNRISRISVNNENK